MTVQTRDRVLHPGSSEEAGFRPAALKGLEERMVQMVNAGHFPGVAWLVARHGIIASHGAAGYANAERQTPMVPETIIWAASTKKPISGTAIMMMWEEGRLELDDPVAKFLPAFATLRYADGSKVQTPLTIRHLLTHTGGIYNTDGAATPEVATGFFATRQPGSTCSLLEFADWLAEQPLLFPPGTDVNYSTPGNTLLCAIVERISGQPYDDFLQERLFTPLSMRDSGFRVPETRWADVAALHENRDGNWQVVRTYQNTLKIAHLRGGAALFTTVHDLAIHAQMLLNGGVYDGQQILAPKTVWEALRPQMPGELKKNAVKRGAAWAVGPSWTGVPASQLPATVTPLPRGENEPQRFFSHVGATGTFVVGDHDADLVIVFAAQARPIGNARQAFARAVLATLA